jgi:hypothetical protein
LGEEMNWKHTIELNKKLTELNEDYDSDNELELAPVMGNKMANWLETQKTEMLSKNIHFPQQFIEHFRIVKTEARFNRIINDLFDWCDDNSIWCGFS